MSQEEQAGEISIRPIAGVEAAATCARLMTESEPWRTLGRDYATSLRVVSDSTREVSVAARGAEVVGFLILNMAGAFVGYIQTICVAPGARGQGLGTRLVAFAEARIFRESLNVFMTVSSFNAGARRLYERLGYQRVGELSDYLVAGHAEILLRKTRGPLSAFHPRQKATKP